MRNLADEVAADLAALKLGAPLRETVFSMEAPLFLTSNMLKKYRTEYALEREFTARVSATWQWTSHRVDSDGHADRLFFKPAAARYVEFKTDSALSALQAARAIDCFSAGLQYAIVRPEGAMLWLPRADDQDFFDAVRGEKIPAFNRDIKMVEGVLRARV